jgi:hypothetical protein
MSKNRANNPADAVNPVSAEVLEAFRKQNRVIIERSVEAAMQHTEEVAQHGDDAVRLLTSGMQFTLKMLESAMSFGELSILDDEIKWALDRLPHDGVLPEHLISRFEILKLEIHEVLGPEYASQIVPYLDWMAARISEPDSSEKPFIVD